MSEDPKVGDLNAAPTTTAEQDAITSSQRNINLMWETTQKGIAKYQTSVAVAVAAVLALSGKHLGTPELQLAAVVFLFGSAQNIAGFYFGRTNHQKTGGVQEGQTGR